ncbi:MAG: 1,4-alpha-glucan branching protein GlgB [Planctomycetota bacterium]
MQSNDTDLTHETIDAIVQARHTNPFSVLGPHPVQAEDGSMSLSVRGFVPGAVRMWVLPSGSSEPVEAKRLHVEGFFECNVGPVGEEFRYRLRVERSDGANWSFEDPYRFGRVLTDYDTYLFSEGTHYKTYDKLGAHVQVIDGIHGVHFAVWAPNAERVSIIGAFNDWDGRRHVMRALGASGVWEFFLPELTEGDTYKYEIRTREGDLRVKSDPYAFRSELRPGTASIVHTLDQYEWQDRTWIEEGRARANALDRPISIYEVHLGSWRRADENSFLSYRDLADQLVPYVVDMGFTHIELLPVLEHPLDSSWGYQALGHFAPTSRHGTPDDFAHFVDTCHCAGIGVLLDWVPAHFPKDDHGLRYFDGTHLYEHADPRQGEHQDWGTMIFNYDRTEVRNFLLSSALFWLDKYHIDGIRVDAVASMLYNDYSREEGQWLANEFGGRENLGAVEFIKRFNALCHEYHPGVLTIAEESTAWPGVSHPTYAGGLGFSMKWNMGWMNDTLDYFSREPVHRKYHHQSLTFSLLYAFTENFMLPLSHDEVVHGKCSLLDKMPGDGWQKFANLRLLYTYLYTHPGKKLLFMGQEFGQGAEWNSNQSLDWHLLETDYHTGIQNLVRDLNRLYRAEPALSELDFDWKGFDWIDFHDWEKSLISYTRRSRMDNSEVVVVLNFTPEPRGGYRIGVPGPGLYAEALNSDSGHYVGSNIGNGGGVEAEEIESHGSAWSISLNIPPLGGLILRRLAPKQ